MSERIKYTGSFEQTVPSLNLFLRPGDVFEVDDPDIAADLLRREGYFERAEGQAESAGRQDVNQPEGAELPSGRRGKVS